MKVRASKAQLTSGKRIKGMAKRDPDNSSSYVIIGGGKVCMCMTKKYCHIYLLVIAFYLTA